MQCNLLIYIYLLRLLSTNKSSRIFLVFQSHIESINLKFLVTNLMFLAFKICSILQANYFNDKSVYWVLFIGNGAYFVFKTNGI